MRVSAIPVKGSGSDSALGRGLGSVALFLCHDSCLKNQNVMSIFESSRPFSVVCSALGRAFGRGLGSEASFLSYDSCLKTKILRAYWNAIGHFL